MDFWNNGDYCLKVNKIGRSRKYDNEFDDKSPPFDPITMLSL